MKDIPSIGTARGVFDIFMPGVFLLLHLVVAASSMTARDARLAAATAPIVNNALLSSAAFVCFAYLAGMLLRLLKTDFPDKLSGRFNLLCRGRKWWPAGRPFLREKFPYFAYIEHVAGNYLPSDALEFYNKTWLPRAGGVGNRQYFNFCKILVNAVDERSGLEAHAAEATTRYVSSMFYALVGSALLIAVPAIIVPSVYLWCITAIYLGASFVILHNLRFLRFKEVEAIFTATYYNHWKGTLPLKEDTSCEQ